jgi:Uma2 family endonuclease
MPLVIEDNWLPATLTAPPMTDEQFAEFCSEHPDLFFEMTAEGDLIIMPPNFSLTGLQNAEIIGQLRDWARREGRGRTGDSSMGFVLPNGARPTPHGPKSAVSLN